jgi:hypothetical protein
MTGAELLQPVFHFLDTMIREYGEVLYLLLVYASIPLIRLDFERRAPAKTVPPIESSVHSRDMAAGATTTVAAAHHRR